MKSECSIESTSGVFQCNEHGVGKQGPLSMAYFHRCDVQRTGTFPSRAPSWTDLHLDRIIWTKKFCFIFNDHYQYVKREDFLRWEDYPSIIDENLLAPFHDSFTKKYRLMCYQKMQCILQLLFLPRAGA